VIMNTVELLAGADTQLQQLYSNLEDLRDGLGDQFYADFRAACDLLARFPELAPRHRHRFRRYFLRHWKTGIFYAINGSRLMIVGVMDLRQDPTQIDRWLEQF